MSSSASCFVSSTWLCSGMVALPDYLAGCDWASSVARLTCLSPVLTAELGERPEAFVCHDDGRPHGNVAERIEEDGQIYQAEGDRTAAEQAGRPRPLAGGRGGHAAGDPPDRLGGHDKAERCRWNLSSATHLACSRASVSMVFSDVAAEQEAIIFQDVRQGQRQRLG